MSVSSLRPLSSQNRKIYNNNNYLNGAIQYHDVDLDILNLENVNDGTSVGSGVTDIASPLNIDDQYGNPISPINQDPIVYSAGGILCENTIEKGLLNLNKTADGFTYAYLNLNISGYDLNNVDLLKNYEYLQKLDLSHNKLSNLDALNGLSNLIELNVSYNQLTDLCQFKPSQFLRVADFTHNKLTQIKDLAAHNGLHKLILDYNLIKNIDGLTHSSRLRYLSLSHNEIMKISGLENLPIQFLNLSYNKINLIEGLETLQRLQKIYLAGNKIRSLKGLELHEALSVIDIENNEVIDIEELRYIKQLPMLRKLILLRCPIQEIYDYRLLVLFEIPHLTELDTMPTEIEEKVKAQNLYKPSIEILAQRDHRLNMVYSFFQPHNILDSTLQSPETPYPMLVLVGPQGSGKHDLALKLTQEFPEFFGYGISHTTRAPHDGEESGVDYHFVNTEEFESLQMKGKFIETILYQGHLYGLTMDALEAVAREGLACVVHMELEGVLATKLTYLEPRYVLTIPLNKQDHETRLRQKGFYYEKYIAQSVQRSELYKEYNQKHPGFFDMIINTNEINTAYVRLRQLVMDYLGLSGSNNAETPFTAGRMMNMRKENTAGGETSGAKSETRSWSKASIPLSARLISGAVARSASNNSIGQGTVEQESLKRRYGEAKEIISGVRKSAIDDALKKAFVSTEDQQGFDYSILQLDVDGRKSDKNARSTSLSTQSSDLHELNSANSHGHDSNGSYKKKDAYRNSLEPLQLSSNSNSQLHSPSDRPPYASKPSLTKRSGAQPVTDLTD